jgi:hypothetical protein
METCIFQVASNFSDATLRGEDCQYCGTFHSILAIVLLDD